MKAPLKVLLVNGSPNPRGNTAIALAEVAKTLEAEGLAHEEFQLGRQPVRGCIACGGCRRDDSNGHCVFDDDPVNRLIDAAGKADAFVFGTPVYFGQPNGALLAMIQRALFAGGQHFRHKPFASVAVCRRGGATAAFETMNMAFQMCNMPQATSQYWNLVYGLAPGEAALDIEGLQTMRTLARNLSWMLRCLHAPSAPARTSDESKRPMNFIRPHNRIKEV